MGLETQLAICLLLSLALLASCEQGQGERSLLSANHWWRHGEHKYWGWRHHKHDDESQDDNEYKHHTRHHRRHHKQIEDSQEVQHQHQQQAVGTEQHIPVALSTPSTPPAQAITGQDAHQHTMGHTQQPVAQPKAPTVAAPQQPTAADKQPQLASRLAPQPQQPAANTQAPKPATLAPSAMPRQAAAPVQAPEAPKTSTQVPTVPKQPAAKAPATDAPKPAATQAPLAPQKAPVTTVPQQPAAKAPTTEAPKPTTQAPQAAAATQQPAPKAPAQAAAPKPAAKAPMSATKVPSTTVAPQKPAPQASTAAPQQPMPAQAVAPQPAAKAPAAAPAKPAAAPQAQQPTQAPLPSSTGSSASTPAQAPVPTPAQAQTAQPNTQAPAAQPVQAPSATAVTAPQQPAAPAPQTTNRGTTRALLHAAAEPQALLHVRPSKAAAAAKNSQAFEPVISPDGDLLAVALRKKATTRNLLQEELTDDQLWAVREDTTANTSDNGDEAGAADSMGEGYMLSSVTPGDSPSGHGGMAEVQGSMASSDNTPESYQVLQGDIPAEDVGLQSIIPVQDDSSDDDSDDSGDDGDDNLSSFATGGDRRLLRADHLPLKRKLGVPVMGSRPGLAVAANNRGGLYNHAPHFYMGQANRHTHAHGRKMLDYGHGHSWGGYGGHNHGYGGWGYGGHGNDHHHGGYEHHHHGGYHGWGRKLLRAQQAL